MSMLYLPRVVVAGVVVVVNNTYLIVYLYLCKDCAEYERIRMAVPTMDRAQQTPPENVAENIPPEDEKYVLYHYLSNHVSIMIVPTINIQVH